MAALLLLCVASSGISKKRTELFQQTTLQGTCATKVPVGTSNDAVFSGPGDDIFTFLLSSNRQGLSFSMLYRQMTTERPISFSSIQQRMARTAMVHLYGNIATDSQRNTLCHIVASIRFHIGSFIYHRCQMRC